MEGNLVFSPWNIKFLINKVVDVCLPSVHVRCCIFWTVCTEFLGDRTSLFSVSLKVSSCSFIWCSACCCWCGDLLLIDFSFLFSFFSTSSPINARLFSFCLLFQFQFLFFYFLFFWSFDRSLFFFFSFQSFNSNMRS